MFLYHFLRSYPQMLCSHFAWWRSKAARNQTFTCCSQQEIGCWKNLNQCKEWLDAVLRKMFNIRIPQMIKIGIHTSPDGNCKCYLLLNITIHEKRLNCWKNRWRKHPNKSIDWLLYMIGSLIESESVHLGGSSALRVWFSPSEELCDWRQSHSGKGNV